MTRTFDMPVLLTDSMRKENSKFERAEWPPNYVIHHRRNTGFSFAFGGSLLDAEAPSPFRPISGHNPGRRTLPSVGVPRRRGDNRLSAAALTITARRNGERGRRGGRALFPRV